MRVLLTTTNEPPAIETPDLVAALGRSPRRVRAAVQALEARGLVEVRQTPGHALQVWHMGRAELWAYEHHEDMTRYE